MRAETARRLLERLDPDAAVIFKAILDYGVPPMVDMGIEKSRQIMESVVRAPGPEVFSVSDTFFKGSYGSVPVRVYQPDPEPTGTAVVYYHGGGMIVGTLDSYDGLARNLSRSIGATVFSVDYRLAPEFTYPVGSDEAYEALCWVSEQAATFGVDARRIAVAGDSAGGGLAAGVALRSRDEGGPALAAQILLYPGLERYSPARSSMVEFAEGPLISTEDIVWMKNLYLGDDPTLDTPYGTPMSANDLHGVAPAILVSGVLDPLRDGIEEYARRLREADVQVALLLYPGVYHGFLSNIAGLARARTALRDLAALTRNLLDAP